MSVNLQKSVSHMLYPLIRLLLRHGVTHAEFADWAKKVYVTEAKRNFGVNEKPPTVSRIAIVTGINRKEVKRLQELPVEQTQDSTKRNRAARVITGWLQDTEYHDESGQPRALDYGEADKEFNLLVKQYSGDVPARAVLDELVRVGTVSRTSEGQVKLVRSAYVPYESAQDMLDIFAESAADLLETLDHNLSSPATNSRLQLSVAYDNLSAETVGQFRKLSREKATLLLKQLDKFLSTHDRDTSEQSDAGGRYRAGLGIYLIENEVKTDDSEHD